MKMERIEKRIAILYSLRKERMNKLLKEYHLTYEDYQIVLALHYAEGLSLDLIQTETKIDKRFIMSVIQHLKEKDYIYIQDDQIYLTDKTKLLYPQLKRIIKKSNEEFDRQISTEDYHEIVENLDKLIDLYDI